MKIKDKIKPVLSRKRGLTKHDLRLPFKVKMPSILWETITTRPKQFIKSNISLFDDAQESLLFPLFYGMLFVRKGVLDFLNCKCDCVNLWKPINKIMMMIIIITLIIIIICLK